MSKGNMLLGHARGKVGSLVFSRSNGKQIVRARAEVVKNPQTEAQMIQRIILNTVSQAYSRMAAITDHSFEGVATGQASMSQFMRLNMDNIRQRVSSLISQGAELYEIFAFSPLKSAILACNDYVISKGKLPVVPVISANSDNSAAIAVPANTYGDVISRYGLQRGDQLTFVAIVADDREDATFEFARVILSPVDAAGNELPLSTPFIVDGAINAANPRNEGVFSALNFADGKIQFAFGRTYLMAAGVIVSRRGSDGLWLRSNCTLFMNETSNAGFSMLECLTMAGASSIDTTNDRYLNNSGSGRLAVAGSAAAVITLTAASALGATFTGSSSSGAQVRGNVLNCMKGDSCTIRVAFGAPVGDTIVWSVDGVEVQRSTSDTYTFTATGDATISVTAEE